MQNPTWYNNQVHGCCCNIAVQSCYFIIPWQHVQYEHGCWFIMMVPTTLFKSVRSSSHKQSVPTCMNKPVNNTVQAGQLNYVQACQQRCSSWPAQPCSSLSTTLFKLASSTMFKIVNNHVQAGQLNHVQACQQPCSSWPAQPCPSLSTGKKQAVRFYVCKVVVDSAL